jgi:hypothetical protein
MSESDDTNFESEPYLDQFDFTVTLNGSEYELNESWRDAIERRAANEYEGNHLFECYWRVATEEDAADEDTIHNTGDPILVIETEGPMVPWEKLDQLELEEQTPEAFDSVDSGSGSDVDEGNGMRTVKPGEVQDSDEEREKNRTHFEVTPQDFQDVPSPEGEDPERVPAKPEEFDSPKMVMWVPDNPEIEHSWGAGEAISPMYNWVEWNVQAKADQPRPAREKDDSHDHYETLAKSHDCEEIDSDASESELSKPETNDEPSGSVKRKGEGWFEGERVGDRWNV